MDASPNLRFSNSRSFRLFTEGVQALRSYEQSAQKASLDKAANILAECVSDYQDVLPRLYLGIVRYHQGEAIGDAVTLLNNVLDRKIPELKPTATYYLAEAYASKYTDKGIDDADEILRKLLTDDTASITATDRLRVEGLRTFIFVRQNLWKKRTGLEDLTKEEGEAAKRVSAFKTNIEDAKVPEDVKSSLRSHQSNAKGLLEEYRANRATDVAEKQRLAQESLHDFEVALGYGANRADAISNQARVYHELLKNDEKAIRLAAEVLAIRPDDSFAHLLLGRIYEPGQPQKAVDHYHKAQAKFLAEAAVGAGRCYDELGETDNALDEYSKVEQSTLFFGEANYRAGLIQQRLGRMNEARESYLRAKDNKDYAERAQEALRSLENKQPG